MKPRRAPSPAMVPLTPQRKWRAITLATLLFAPAYWSVVGGAVSAKLSDRPDAPSSGPLIAFGLALLPFVLLVLAFLSEHPRASSATWRSMVLSLVVGIGVVVLTRDVITGLVAGMGAGGVVALRADLAHDRRTRVVGVVLASGYAFLLANVAPGAAVLMGPVLPFTAVGVADHVAERRQERAASRG